MRYLLVMAAVGEALGRRLVEAGVGYENAQAWLNGWDNSMADLLNAKPGSFLSYSYTFTAHIQTYRQLLEAPRSTDDDE